MNRFSSSFFTSSLRRGSSLILSSPQSSTPSLFSPQHPSLLSSSFFSTRSSPLSQQHDQRQQRRQQYQQQFQQQQKKYPTPAPPKQIDPFYKKMMGILLSGALLFCYKHYESTFAFHLIHQEDYDDPPLPPTDLEPTKFVYLDVQIGEEPPSRVVIGVYANYVPKTSYNFIELAKGCDAGHYKNTTFHQTQQGFLIQGGDVEDKCGFGGMSVYGKTFKDEIAGIGMPHKKGKVTMANYGRHTNSSQFAICAQDCFWMDRRHVVFGEVVEGMGTVEKIANLEVDGVDHPMTSCVIVDSGALPKYKEKKE